MSQVANQAAQARKGLSQPAGSTAQEVCHLCPVGGEAKQPIPNARQLHDQNNQAGQQPIQPAWLLGQSGCHLDQAVHATGHLANNVKQS